ncbi:hypothetical protein PsAD2_01885 [Pseudovibrio axinellae]|uniref:Uncharacterized protein n=1 Tax=Pseudovibrio axinellae TaxID=989403 RepID=A0A165Z8Q9_9HYPH|nr:hypothetical protein PsAD2_01885 [Pseudovibrio axinellae]SEQ33923.1 hypothetical protein SAMN05421798_102446 [Pseudovibrio axinellae]
MLSINPPNSQRVGARDLMHLVGPSMKLVRLKIEDMLRLGKKTAMSTILKLYCRHFCSRRGEKKLKEPNGVHER